MGSEVPGCLDDSWRQDSGKPVTLPHDASVARPRDAGEPNGEGTVFVEENCYYYTKEFW